MAHILKAPAKVHGAKTFLNNFYDNGGADRIYLGLSDYAWTIPPIDSFDEEETFWANLIGVGEVSQSSDTELVVPRKTWASGSTYVVFDESAESGTGTFDTGTGRNFYVCNTELAPKVYECIVAGGGTSTDEPTHTDPSPTANEADGYRWKYLYTIGSGGDVSAATLTTTWMPVPGITSGGIAPYADATAYGLGGLAEGDGSGTYSVGQIYQVDATTGSSSGANMNADANNTWVEWEGDYRVGAFWVEAAVAFPDSAGTGSEIPNVAYKQVGLLRNPKNAAGARLTAQWEGTDFEASLSRGVVLTVDNRGTITRAVGQTETVRIILEF